MRNRTHMSIPDPVEKMKISVRQQPGQSYPTPPSRVRIKEQNIAPGYPTGAPGFYNASRVVLRTNSVAQQQRRILPTRPSSLIPGLVGISKCGSRATLRAFEILGGQIACSL